MDFLKIRKKAKERAQARAAEESTAPRRTPAADAPAVPDPEPRRPAPPDAPVVTEADLLEGALVARLQGLPAPGEPPPRPEEARGAIDDARFTTWRPGADAAPFVPSMPEAEALAGLATRDEDFTLVAPAVAGPPVALLLAHPAPARAARHSPSTPPPGDPLDEFFYRPDEAAPALPEIAASEAPLEIEPTVLAREEFLTFLLGAEEYAIAIERVREVVKAPPITEVPRAPAHILGVVTVRGEVVAVVDPRLRFGLPAGPVADGEARIVIVDAGDGACGLQVDRVASVVRLRPGSIEPCPQGIAGQSSEFLAGIGREGDRLFTVLDLGALLRRAPARERRARRADGAA